MPLCRDLGGRLGGIFPRGPSSLGMVKVGVEGRGDARKRRRSDSFPQATDPFACSPQLGRSPECLKTSAKRWPARSITTMPCLQPRAPGKVARRVPPKIRPLGALALDSKALPRAVQQVVRWCVGEKAPGCRALAGDWLDGRLWEKGPGGKRWVAYMEKLSYRRRIQSLERIVESSGRTGLRDGMGWRGESFGDFSSFILRRAFKIDLM
jgi:hypothetical protein